VGLNFTIGLAGLPSLGQGAFVGAGAFTTAWLRAHGGWEPIPATLAGVTLAFVAGAVVGYGAVRLRGVFVAVSTWIVAWMLSFILFVAVLLAGEGRVLGPAVGAGLLVLIPGAARGLGSFAGVGLARYEPVLAAVLLVVGLLLGRGGVVRILERAFRSIGPRP